MPNAAELAFEPQQGAEQPAQIDGRSTGPRIIWPAIRRGSLMRCPACGKGQLFRRYLKVADACPACGEALHHHRADDAPPYFTIVILGHVIVSLVLVVEVAYHPPLWVHMAIWMPLTVILALILLPRVKGALIGLQWALLMHGFDPNYTEDLEVADPGEPGASPYFPRART